MINFAISHDGTKWFAKPNGEAQFYVGTTHTYKGQVGLQNWAATSNVIFKADNWAGVFGHWAYAIEPTAMAESNGNFNTINTYDRALFTFGFGQFAAHVPEGDFVQFLRALIAQDNARLMDYFPDLSLQNGKISQKVGSAFVNLEQVSDSKTKALMRYFNPSSQAIEDREVQNCARMMHWCMKSQKHRSLQVQYMISTAKTLVAKVHGWSSLNKRTDKVCLAAMDILHQGRGSKSSIVQALTEKNDNLAFDRLLHIGASSYPERIQTIRATVQKLEAQNKLNNAIYDGATGKFVPR